MLNPLPGHAQVLVFGAGGAGKSELLQALAGARLPPAAAAAGEGLTALAQVERERDRARTQPACVFNRMWVDQCTLCQCMMHVSRPDGAEHVNLCWI